MSDLHDQLSQLVYSTDKGRIKPDDDVAVVPEGDGIVRIHRQTKGRKGKGVTIIDGLAIPADDLKELAKKLKQICGVGGSVKAFTIELQGDQREPVAAWLKQAGYKVKLAGG